MAVKNSVLIKNEHEANLLSCRIMLISILVLGAVYVLEYIRVFTDDMNSLNMVFPIIAIMLLIPVVFTYAFKAEGAWLKYMFTSIAALAISVINMFLSKDVIVLYIYATAIASLYFSRKLSWYSVIFSMVSLTFSQIIATNNSWFDDKNYGTDWFTPVLSRNIELFILALIFIILAKRTKNMLQNVMGVEEQKIVTDRLESVISKSTEVSAVLAGSVSSLSEITGHTIKANEQIAENTSQLASSSDNTLKFIDQAVGTVEVITASLNKIAEEGRLIADVSQQANNMTMENGLLMKNAVDEMSIIEQTTTESREIINKLEEKSGRIGKIVEVITAIAQQTNLLALNAAIESARAGEQGKGFAVVSDEIRKLAEQSGKAAKDISNLIKEVLQDTEKAVAAMSNNTQLVAKGRMIINEAGTSFEKVSSAGRTVNDKIQEVSSETQKIAKSGEKITDIVINIRDINHKSLSELQGIAASTEQQLASMQQVAASVDALEKTSNELMEVIMEKS
jgi:methyl-accepting chemotaxis protein